MYWAVTERNGLYDNLEFSIFPALADFGSMRLSAGDGRWVIGRQARASGRGKAAKSEDLLARIDAYGGRKERNGTADLA